MEQFFELPVTYRGQELLLPGRLVSFAYSYKLYITVEGEEWVFERDDYGEFRVMTEHTSVPHKKIDPELVSAIIEVLEKLSS